MPQRSDKSKSNKHNARQDAILDKALDVFAPNGYLGTTTDMLAKEASISKQTLYKHFGDKDGVFAALVHRACERVVDPFAPLVSEMHSVETAAEAVRMLADQFVGSIMDSGIQKLRRLVIAEAPRFPHLAEEYWQSGFERMLGSLSRCFAILDSRKLLHIPKPEIAAQHFAGMLLWIPGNRSMFQIESPSMEEVAIDALISAGADVFLRAYAPSGVQGTAR